MVNKIKGTWMSFWFSGFWDGEHFKHNTFRWDKLFVVVWIGLIIGLFGGKIFVDSIAS